MNLVGRVIPSLPRTPISDADKPNSLKLLNSIYLSFNIDGTTIDAVNLGNNLLSFRSWHVLVIDQFEKFHPHFAARIGLSDLLTCLDNRLINDVYQDLHSRTGRTYKDCFLYGL